MISKNKNLKPVSANDMRAHLSEKIDLFELCVHVGKSFGLSSGLPMRRVRMARARVSIAYPDGLGHKELMRRFSEDIKRLPSHVALDGQGVARGDCRVFDFSGKYGDLKLDTRTIPVEYKPVVSRPHPKLGHLFGTSDMGVFPKRGRGMVLAA